MYFDYLYVFDVVCSHVLPNKLIILIILLKRKQTQWLTGQICIIIIIMIITDDEFMFREQYDNTTVENLINGCSPTVESLFLHVQPKIYLLVQLIEFPNDVYEETANEIKENTIKACGLVRGFHNKATMAHIYHYYSIKLGEIWNENNMISQAPNQLQSPVETQSIDIMTVRHAFLTSLIKTIRTEITNMDTSESVSYARILMILYFLYVCI